MNLILATCLLARALAAPPQAANFDRTKAEILEHSNENNGLGRYNFSYKQGDGTEHYQTGKVLDGHIVVEERYPLVEQDNVTYSVGYTADENSNQPIIEDRFSPDCIYSCIG